LTFRYIIRWAYNSGKSQKIAYGPSLLAFYPFLRAILTWFNPLIKYGKSGRVQKVAIMVEQVGTII